MTHDNPNHKASVVLLGATGTIGRATAQALVAAGHKVTCPVRRHAPHDEFALPHTAEIVVADVTDPDAIDKQVFANRSFDVMVSCLASRNGRPDDAWAIDHKANVDAFACAKASGVKHIVYLSAICVQKPRLAFQHAKLAAENALIDLGGRWNKSRRG
ncbi:MAG: NAD(P)H-binding protein, partial [Pseudomonadota bacterium]